jgi:3-keto-L-gulonate-6-phosphate decarboxylase
MKRPWLQIAVDTLDLETARRYAMMAVEAGADWVEAGTPLIIYQGMKAIETLVSVCKSTPVVADFKVEDGVAKYFIKAGQIGAKIATVLGIAPDGSIKEAVRGAREGGVEVLADLSSMKLSDLATRANELERLGVDYVLLHLGFDESKNDPSKSSLDGLDELLDSVDIPVGVATFTEEEAVMAVKRGASFIVQGEPIMSAPDAPQKLKAFIESVKSAV